MPRNKDLKRLVRARMKRTGEAYTAALARITSKPRKRTSYKATSASARRTARSSAAKIDYATIAGMSDEKLKTKTGCTWERWVAALDYHKAEKMSHAEIATLVSEKYKVADWWSQMVTVGYERIKGLRARGQRRDGTYEANKSRTFDVPVTKLFDAWVDDGVRNRWLNESGVRVRTATAPKSIRLGWPDGGIVAVGFTARGKSKSSVALAHTKLPDRATVERLKNYWSGRLEALGEVVSNERAGRSVS